MRAFALVEKSIWAIVVGSLVSSVAKTLLSHIAISGTNNKFAWESRAFKELFGYGKWIFVTTIMGFFVRSSDKLILAGLVSSQVLGVYTIAIFVTNALQDIMTRWASAVAFPMLSKVYRERPEDLIKVYYKFRLPFDVLILFICGFLYNAGYILIEVLYDSRYETAKHMIEILSIGKTKAYCSNECIAVNRFICFDDSCISLFRYEWSALCNCISDYIHNTTDMVFDETARITRLET